MKNDLTLSEVSPSEWISLNQFLQEIKQIDSPCISVYYPYGKGHEIVQLDKQGSKYHNDYELATSYIKQEYV